MSNETDFEKYKRICYYLSSKFIKKYGPVLYSHRDDIHQEAALALLEALNNKDNVYGSFVTYVYNSVHNQLKRYIMNVFKHKCIYIEDVDLNLGYDIDFKFLLDLTDNEKNLFIYHFVEGNPIKETAKKFGLRWEDCNGKLMHIKHVVVDGIKNG